MLKSIESKLKYFIGYFLNMVVCTDAIIKALLLFNSR